MTFLIARVLQDTTKILRKIVSNVIINVKLVIKLNA